MAKIAVIGIATVDIINVVEHYPREDEELRAVDQTIQRGGNAANTAVVLAQLGHQVAWIGNLADDVNAGIVEQDLAAYSVDTRLAVRQVNSTTPTSYITLNQQNASRTIVHYRQLDELKSTQVNPQELACFDWLHFEGRNIGQTATLLKQLKTSNKGQRISIEFEKRRGDEEMLFEYADVLVFSRHYFAEKNITEPHTAIASVSGTPEQMVVCSWGDQGAYFRDQNNVIRHSPPQEINQKIDSVGAGDCFNAGLIHALVQETRLAEAVNQANRLAGKKIGQRGFHNLIAD